MHDAWPVVELLYQTGRTIWPGEKEEEKPKYEMTPEQQMAWDKLEIQKLLKGVKDKPNG